MEFIVRALRGWAVPLVIPIPQAWRATQAGRVLDDSLAMQLRALGAEVARAAEHFAAGRITSTDAAGSRPRCSRSAMPKFGVRVERLVRSGATIASSSTRRDIVAPLGHRLRPTTANRAGRIRTGRGSSRYG